MSEQDLVFLIQKIQQQLNFLEKKLDILIYSKSYRSFDSSHRRGAGERGSVSGERGFAQGRSFEKPHGVRKFEKSRGGESRGFGQKKRPFYHGRKERG